MRTFVNEMLTLSTLTGSSLFLDMTNKTLRALVWLGAAAIGSIVLVQAYWMVYTWNTEDQKLNQRIFVALKNVSESLAKYNGTARSPEHPVRQLAGDYYVVRVDDIIDTNVLEHYLRTELAASDVLTSFEYAIYDCADNRMMYGNRVNPIHRTVSIAPPRSLPTYDEYTYYFGVLFPEKSTALLGSIQPWLLLSGGLVMVVVFFCYALTVMLRQKQLSELQKDFINNMTHEFKTPIATINVSADVLMSPRNTISPERFFRYATVVKEQTLRLNQQVERVLQIARIEQRRPCLHQEPLNIHEIVEQVAAGFSTRYPDRLQLTVDLRATSPVVLTDEFHLTNVLYNLLDNAVKYSPSVAHVRVTTQGDEKALRLQVADQGIGIAPAFEKKVFAKFFRVPTGNVHNVKGFGLGLYYVRQVCRMHRWQITVSSTLHEGSVFIITIPQ